MRPLVARRGAWLLHRPRATRGDGAQVSVPISVAATREENASGCCEHRGRSDQVGVRCEASGSHGRRRVVGARMAGIVPTFVRRAGLFDHRRSSRASSCSSSSPVSAVRRRCAALAGASKRRGTLGLFDLVSAHSNDRITTKWSRRGRRSCAIMSLCRAAHLER